MRINHACVDISCKRAAVDKRREAFVDFVVCFFNNLTDDVVASRGKPKCSRLTVIAEIVNNRPRVKNIRLAEAVAVIPFANLVELIRSTVVRRHFFYFVCSKSEIFAVFIIEDRIYCKVIQPTENAFFGNAENTCEETECQTLIILETAGQKITHKRDNIIVETVCVTALNWSVILINDDNSTLTVMFFQHFRQIQQRPLKVNSRKLFGHHFIVKIFLLFI